MPRNKKYFFSLRQCYDDALSRLPESKILLSRLPRSFLYRIYPRFSVFGEIFHRIVTCVFSKQTQWYDRTMDDESVAWGSRVNIWPWVTRHNYGYIFSFLESFRCQHFTGWGKHLINISWRRRVCFFVKWTRLWQSGRGIRIRFCRIFRVFLRRREGADYFFFSYVLWENFEKIFNYYLNYFWEFFCSFLGLWIGLIEVLIEFYLCCVCNG